MRVSLYLWECKLHKNIIREWRLCKNFLNHIIYLSVFLNKQCQSSKTEDASFPSKILCTLRYTRELSCMLYWHTDSYIKIRHCHYNLYRHMLYYKKTNWRWPKLDIVLLLLLLYLVADDSNLLCALLGSFLSCIIGPLHHSWET